MKKLLAFTFLLALILICNPFTLEADAATQNNVVDISVSIPETAKIGQAWAEVTPEISVTGTVGRYALVAGTGENDVYFDYRMQWYVGRENSLELTLNLYPDLQGKYYPLPAPERMTFVINDLPVESYNITIDTNENGEYYCIRSSVNISITGRTTYQILTETDQFNDHYSIVLDRMPTEAEAGVNVCFRGRLEQYSNVYLLDYFTVNGKQIADGEFFVMPEYDVTVGVKVTDQYESWEYVPEVNITLDFKDRDIYYGNRIPTNEEFFNAISVSCTTPGAKPYVWDANISTMWDESTGGDLPWVGNQFLSFWIDVEEGYLLCNPYISGSSYDELGEWLNENLKVTVNGTERTFIGGYDHLNGYMVSGYFVSAPNRIEIHIEWYFTQEMDIDLSGYQPGDTVTIEESDWAWDGYMPTGYLLRYTDPELGEITETIFGKSFQIPVAEGEIKVLANAVRGKYNPAPEDMGSGPQVVKQQSEDSYGHISLDLEEGTFPDVTVLQINKVNGDDFYGRGYEILDLVNRTLSDVASVSVTFELTAFSYNREVQPTKKIVVSFPIPEGFDSKYIAFYHVSKNGTYQIVETIIDYENGICYAAIDHFSTYTIVSLKENPGTPDTPDAEQDIIYWNLTLGNDLGVNFHVGIADSQKDNAYVQITVAGGTPVSYKVSEAMTDANGNYIFSVHMAAAQMNDTITLQLVVDDTYGQLYEYSVVEYAKAVLADDSLYAYHTIVKEMLNYGAAAQRYFGYNTHNIADEYLYKDTGLQDIDAANAPAMKVSNVNGITFCGATLLFEAKTTVRIYFTGDAYAYKFLSGENILTPAKKNGMWYVDIENINPYDLEEAITVTANGSHLITYSPMNYIVRMNQKGSEGLKQLLKAMYNYYLAAESLQSKV